MPAPAKTVLLVLSEPTLGEITSFRLELKGYQVRRATTLTEAMAALERERPGLILVDLSLDTHDGLQLAERIGGDSRFADIPLVALSSSADLDEVQRAFAAGAEDYLVTPYDPVVLEQKVDRWLPLF